MNEEDDPDFPVELGAARYVVQHKKSKGETGLVAFYRGLYTTKPFEFEKVLRALEKDWRGVKKAKEGKPDAAEGIQDVSTAKCVEIAERLLVELTQAKEGS